MKRKFKPAIKHDVVTGTYTIRDKHGVVIQVQDELIDSLYGHLVEENEKLKIEVQRLKGD